MRGSKALTLLFFILLGFTASAQSERQALERQKQDLLKKIQQTQKILSQTEEKKDNSLGRLRALNNQIRSRSSLITAIKSEVGLLDEKIAEDQSIIDAMEGDLNALKSEYAQMIYATQKQNAGFNKLTFLFASSTFNQLFMRMKYIQQYGDARKKQGEQIVLVQSDLQDQIAEVQVSREEKQGLLTDELTENRKLQGLQSQQRSLISKLEQQEDEIRRELRRQIASEKELTNRIDAIIEAERRAALANSIDMSSLTEAFAEEKGKLPWPVEEGFVSSKYGTHKHPTLKRVTLNNKGIDIQTTKDAYVKSIFAGKVVGVMSIAGQGNTVLIQHGEFFTAYSRLKAVTVQKDQEVQIGERLGQVLTNSKNVSEMKLRINAPKGTVNPESWLQSKINQP